MRFIKGILFFCLMIIANNCFSQNTVYSLGEDSKQQDNVPKGKVTKYEILSPVPAKIKVKVNGELKEITSSKL